MATQVVTVDSRMRPPTIYHIFKGMLATYNKNKMAKNSSALNDLQNYIRSLDLDHKTTIHVNGKEHPTALVVVDFGYPTPPVRLNSEQSQDLASKMRKFARELVNKDVNIRVSSDNYLGVVYWCSVQ